MLSWRKDTLKILLSDLITQACESSAMTADEVSVMMNATDSQGRWQLDSLGSYQAAAYVALFFGMDETFATDNLYCQPNLDTWVDECHDYLTKKPEVTITFYTSGTTSAPKKVAHKLKDLVAEMQQWQAFISKPKSILCGVPLNHIYGFIWGLVFAHLSGAQFKDIRKKLLLSCPDEDCTLFVGIPDTVPRLQMLGGINGTQQAVISAAPCQFQLLQDLRQSGFGKVLQIYGSTETGGVGYRTSDNPSYRLRPDLLRYEQSVLCSEKVLPIQDELVFEDDQTFVIKGRRDGVFQIKGKNVDIHVLTDKLKTTLPIKDLALRVEYAKSTPTLYAMVAIGDEATKNALTQEIIAKADGLIQAVHICFVPEIPKSPTGKVKRWVKNNSLSNVN